MAGRLVPAPIVAAKALCFWGVLNSQTRNHVLRYILAHVQMARACVDAGETFCEGRRHSIDVLQDIPRVEGRRCDGRWQHIRRAEGAGVGYHELCPGTDSQ